MANWPRCLWFSHLIQSSDPGLRIYPGLASRLVEQGLLRAISSVLAFGFSWSDPFLETSSALDLPAAGRKRLPRGC